MTKHERTRIYTLPKFYLGAQDRGGATTARQFPDREFKPEFSRCLPVIATQPAKEKPDVRKESVSFAGPGLILVRLRGTKHASANLHLPIANAKRFSFTSGAEKLYVRMLAITALESIHFLERFLSILSCSHLQSHKIAATSRQRPRSPRYTTVPVRLLLAYLRAHTYTHPYKHPRAHACTHTHTHTHAHHLDTCTYTHT